MRFRSPSSHGSIVLRFSPLDVILAALSPLLALYLRNALILNPFDPGAVVFYVLISLTCSLIGFVLFRIHGGIPGYLSVYDVVDLVKAVLVAELMTCSTVFLFTRLSGIPRSVPAIHALILATGLLAARLVAHIADKNRKSASQPQGGRVEYVVLIGLSDLSVLFMKFLDTCAGGRQRVIGVLEAEPRWIGRSLNGVPVYGPPAYLETLIDEFAVHGVNTDRVVVGSKPDSLPDDTLEMLRSTCARRGLDLVFVPDLFAFGSSNPEIAAAASSASSPGYRTGPLIIPSPYFRVKRLVEATVALILIVSMSPFWLAAGLLAFFDVGLPILFWQRRTGLGGREFQLYKIRTLRPAFDRTGRRIQEERRLSWIGRLLRQTRLDELPQLLSVLDGNMSLIGPRPLLPQDQPADPSMRLAVRPGITGWAQVNGGALLSPEEKEALDAWYIRHASAGLDLRIMMMTIRTLLRGDRRFEPTLAQALIERSRPGGRPNRRLRPGEAAPVVAISGN